MQRRIAALLLGAGLALSLVAAPVEAAVIPDTTEEINSLIKWLIEGGAKLDGFTVGRACADCPRGVHASRELAVDDTIMAVPFSHAYILTKENDTAPDMSATYARHLLLRMHTDLTWNETWGAMWASQPKREDLFTPDLWTDRHLELLQAPTMARRAHWHRSVTEEVYNGTYEHFNFTALPQLLPQADLETFKYTVATISTRYFGRRYHSETDLPHMVPLVEMLNHADDPNAERSDDDEFVYIKALRPIQKGEGITINYKPRTLHRADMSLYSYGFVEARDRPFLASIDVLGFDPRDFFAYTPADDSDYEADEDLSVDEELHRLSARLASLPTTEEEDQEILDSGNLTDWRDRTILTFRVQRKRALSQVLDALDATLGIRPSDGEEEEGEAGGEGEGDAAEEAADEGEEGQEEETKDEL